MKRWTLALGALLLFAGGALAQSQDSLLRRQLELERDFNPTLMDVNKINSLPTLSDPVVKKANTNYSEWSDTSAPALEIAIPKPGAIMTQIPFASERGYATLAGGNYANIDGALGYRILDNERDQLSLSFMHNSTNSKMDYNQPNSEKKNKVAFMDNLGGLSYKHAFDRFAMSGDLSYLHSLFNYYGNTLGTNRLFNEENQQYGVLNVKLGVESDKNDTFEYSGGIDFKNFSTKFMEELGDGGLKGNQVNLHVDLSKPFGRGDYRIGIGGSSKNSFYSDDRKNYSLLSAAPYIGMGGVNWRGRLGADVLFHIAGKTEIRVVPHVDFQWYVSDHSSIYAKVHGGYASNTFIDMMEESRYVSPTFNVKPAMTLADLNLGVKVGELDGFRFDVFGGIKVTEDEHFLILGTNYNEEDTSFDYTYEYLMPHYDKLTHSYVGGAIHNNSWSPLRISLSLKQNFYNLKDEQAKAYNKPGTELDLHAEFAAMPQLKFSLDYRLATDRWTRYNGMNVEMDNINDLGLGAIYKISNNFAVNVKANNLLFQEYDIWYGYPAQSFNIMGGFSFQF